MYATDESTAQFAARHAEYSAAGFYREMLGLHVSSLGLGTNLGLPGEAGNRAYECAIAAAFEGGINFFDTAINYRDQDSERALGNALRQLPREQAVISTKAGFLIPGAIPQNLDPGGVVAGMHSMAPSFLEHQIECSLANLGVDSIDIFYLHNPETQLGFCSQQQLDERLLAAFECLERQAERGTIRHYGVATWEGLRKRGALSLPRLVELAVRAGGENHHFHVVQLPFNLGMVEAYLERPEGVLDAAARLGIAVVASATLLQARLIGQMPESFVRLLPGLVTDAQRAIQFTRSTPGISVALVGMSDPAHVAENLGVARTVPLDPATYKRLYQ
jgi:aryl-alcohol dehydrogenase-like predicted oxidoreductase